MMERYEAIAQGIAKLFHPHVTVTLHEEGVATGEVEMERGSKRIAIPLEEGVMEIRYDLTQALELQKALSALVGAEMPPPVGWTEQIDAVVRDHSFSAATAKRGDKRAIVRDLQQKGLFEHRDAANHVAQALGISRATVYNYLKWAETVRALKVHQVDTFTEERFGGNPAGVVLDANELSPEIMGKIAREMNLSETSFVLSSKKSDFRLRYFTPTGDEVKFCGHSTVGALYMLAHDERFGMHGPGHYRFEVETLAAQLRMEIDIDENEVITVAFEAPPIDLAPSPITHAELADALGIDLAHLDTSQPVMWEATNQDLFATVRSLGDLEEIQVDNRSATRFAREHNIVAFCLLTPETYDPANHVHARGYAPAVGIPEDPFTGSFQGGLAAYLTANGLIPADAQEIGSEQGHIMGRPGSVKIQWIDGRATIIARAVHCFSTEMELK